MPIICSPAGSGTLFQAVVSGVFVLKSLRNMKNAAMAAAAAGMMNAGMRNLLPEDFLSFLATSMPVSSRILFQSPGGSGSE